MLTRRGLITGISSLIVAPAIVRVSSIMPVKPVAYSLADLIWKIDPTPTPFVMIAGNGFMKVYREVLDEIRVIEAR